LATKLGLYNAALLAVGERKLASLAENREPRRALDDAYTGAIRFCLEQGDWKFAQRTGLLTYEPSVTPAFGHPYAFEKPSDCVRVSKFCQDEYFTTPLLAYVEEAGWWYASVQDIYISFVSDGATFGGDMTLWPETFSTYVSLYLASEVCERLTQNATKGDKLEKDAKKALTSARSKDAMQGPTAFPPRGSWNSARGGSLSRERGNRGSLIG